MEKRKIICIVGPTASGKTGWGVSVAKKFDGEIISADSRQVYRGLNIGTGKDLSEYGDIKHHLIDICDPGDKFTMFDWLERARATIEEIFSRGKLPIVIGGTGLYVQSLVEGFELTQKSKLKSQNCNSKVKIYTRQELERKSLGELQKISLKLKANSSQLDTNNPHRLIRAIERAQAGEITTKKKPDFEVLQIAVDLPREELYKRIDQRVEDWFDAGFVKEVQGLLDSGVDQKWLEKIGLEYRILTKYLTQKSKVKSHLPADATHQALQAGNCKLKVKTNNITIQQYNNESFDEMRQKMKYAIHSYARRQLTWFHRFPEIIWCKDLKMAEKEVKNFLL